MAQPAKTSLRAGHLLARLGVSSLYRPCMVAGVLVIVIAAVFLLVRFWPDSPSDNGADMLTPVAEGDQSGGEAVLVIDVAGAVSDPGVYTVDEGSRVMDAVDAAGGFEDDAATSGVNLARRLQDGEQVYIPTENEAASPAPGSSSPSPAGSSLVNINTADEAALCELPGIGEVTARRIVEDREANGPFSSVDDLTRVNGVGPAKLEALRDSATV